jgi:hypothetical protein
MPDKRPMPATDSARDLHDLVGDDATAEFENDPKFGDSNPTASASSESLASMRDTDDEEESDDELEDEDDDDEEDDEDYEDEEEDEELEDEEEDDEEEDDEDEDLEDEEDDDDEEEDEALAASHSYRLVLKRAA